MYKIVYAESPVLSLAIQEVENKINELKSQGWIEQGGISISRTDIRFDFYVAQAMVKNDK